MANAWKRVLSLTLALLMVLSMMPSLALSADAATLSGLTVKDVGLSYTAAASGGVVSWSATDNQISGSVTGSTVNGSLYKKETTTLTITNNKSETANLSFDYSVDIIIDKSFVAINGTKYTASTTGTFGPIELPAGESIDIVLECALTRKGGDNTVTLNITNLALVVPRAVTTTFKPAENGSYTVNGEAVTDELVASNDSSASYVVAATPNADSKFIGWYNATTGSYISSSANATFQFDTDNTVYPVFVPSATAVFAVGDVKFTDLGEAAAYAAADGVDKNIVLVDSGMITGDYTIPAGETLLIPFDDAYTCYTDAPEVVETYTAPVAFKTLTMAPGSSITVNGTMSVSAPHTACKGGSITGGSPAGSAGFVKMEGDSAIKVNNGGVLYAWGFIYGSGSVTCENGSKVYEYMQVTDFRGGSATLEMEFVFPFSQYYIQNIEVPLELMYGAEEYVFTSITVSSITMGMPVRFIGTTNAMFVSKGGTITKEYLTSKDRLEVTVSGDAALNSIILELPPEFQSPDIEDLLAGYGFEDGISSENYILSLNGNITINITSGTTTLAQDLALLPGFELSVGKNAKLNLLSGESMTSETGAGFNVYVYDVDDWGNYVHNNCKFQPVSYAPGRTYNRTAADLTDVVIDINGTVVTDGFLYTTAGGAAITSSEGTGVIVLAGGAGSEVETMQATQNPNVDYAFIEMDSAKLLNADGSYTETANAEAGATFVYASGKWVRAYTVTWVNEDGTVLATDTVAEGEMPGYTGATPTKAGDVQYSYTFSGWSPAVAAVTGNVTYTAAFKAATNSYTITWKNADGTVLATDSVAYGSVPGYAGATPTKAATQQYSYTFAGWDTTPVAVTGDATYTATFTETLNQYTVTWVNADGTVLATDTVDYGTVPSYTGATPTKAATAEYSYTFAGWDTTPVEVKGDVTYTAAYSASKNSYTVTWANEDGTVLATDTVEYGKTPVYTGETPTKASTAEYSYVFSGWTSKIVPVTGNVKYTAAYTQTERTYNVTWIVDGKQTVVPYSVGSAIEVLDAPVKEGYTFAGWGETVPSTMPAKDLTFTAKWNVNSYTVTWIVDGEETVVTYAYGAAITAAADPAKEGYTFTGWDAAIPATMPAKDLTFTAKWDVNSYTVTWIVDGKETVVTYAYGDTVNQVADPSKEGYTFTGWDAAIPATMPAKDLTFTAKWNVNSYTVTWIVDGKKTVEIYAYGAAIQAAADPAKEGYTFTGWDAAIPATMPAKDLTFTAKWEVNKYTVTWIVDGKETVVTYAYGDTVKKVSDPSKEGYTFAGWSMIVPDTMPAKNMTFVAQWTVNKYTVTWIVDGKETVVTYAYGDTVNQVADPAKEGYTFAGWGAAVPATMPAKDLTFTAKWEVNKYTVTWIVDGKEMVVTYAYGDTVKKISDPAKAGHTFAGWDAEIPATMPAKNLTITAKWTVNEYTVTFADEDGTVLSTGKIPYGTVPTAPAAPSKAATAEYTYTFAGWDKEVAAVTGDVTYTATYTAKKNTYEVIFKNADGTVLVSTFLEYGEIPEYTGDEPAKAATEMYTYTFAGWDQEIAPVTGNVTYTAVYTETVNVYTVTWIIDGEETVVTYTFGETVEIPDAPAKEGYTFTGWGAEIPATMPAKDMTFTAQYVVNTYTITWKNADGSVLATQTVNHGELPVYPNGTPEMTHPTKLYIFTGWSDEVVNATADATYTAVYTEKVKNGFVHENGGIYHYIDGELSKAGLIYVDGYFYYVRTTTGEVVCDREYWITYTNDYMEPGMYIFDEEGRMIGAPEVILKDGFVHENGGIYHYKDDSLTYAGLIYVDGYFYYVKTTTGEVVTNRTYWITYTNDMMDPGSYAFDEEGRMIDPPIDAPVEPEEPDVPVEPEEPDVPVEPEEPDVPVEPEEPDVPVEPEEPDVPVEPEEPDVPVEPEEPDVPVEPEEPDVPVEPEEPDVPVEPEEPDVPVEPEVKNGFVKENGGIYHYIDGELSKAGLIAVDGYFYYVRTTTGEVVTNRSYWITYTNGYMDAASYTFDEEGRMVNPPVEAPVEPEEPDVPVEPEEPDVPVEPEEPDVPVEPEEPDTPVEPEEPDVPVEPELKNGFIWEDGVLYHYVDGELSKAGLIAVDGYFYYVRTTTGEVVTNRSYWITYTNGYMEAASYTFDEEGRMVNPPVEAPQEPDTPVEPEEPVVKNGFVQENGGIYHYVDGKLSYAGLIYVDGSYYYVKTTTGEVVCGRTYWITYTNDLMKAGSYTFDAQGRMILN